MTILALDLGIKVGWAILGASQESGMQEFPLDRGESTGMRYLRFRRWLEELIGDPPRVGLVVWEKNFHRGGPATELAYGLYTRIIEVAAVRGLEHAPVHNATLKKWTTGYGRADKAQMRQAVIFKGWLPADTTADDNEVDAVALVRYAKEKFGGGA